MKTMLFVCVAMLILVQVSEAQIPKTISYQGVLTYPSGDPQRDSTYSISFNLYEASMGGTPIWTEQKSLATRRGLFSTQLGDAVAFGSAVRFDKQYWLGIQINPAAELAPRIPLSAAGYSLNSLKADTARVARGVADGAVTTSAIADQSITSQKFVDGTIVTHDIADEAITSAKIANSTIQFQDIGQNGATAQQVMKWNGTAWVAAADNVGVGVGGSGVANRIAKFEGANTISNSSIYDVGGLIGFGTSNPIGNLHLSSNIPGGTQLHLENASTAGRDWVVYSSGSANFVGPGKFVVRDQLSLQDWFVIDTLGKVGLGGIVSPTERLDVAGIVKMTGFKMSPNAGVGKVLMSDATGTGTWQPSAGMSGSGTVNYMPKFVTNSTTLGNSVLSEDAGNVNVGQIAPNTRSRLFVSADDLIGSTPFYAVFGRDTTHLSGYGGFFVGRWRGLTGSAVAPVGDASARDYTGVEGISDGRNGTANTTYGAKAVGSNGHTNYGLYGWSIGPTTSTNYGVYGTASGGATNWAGYFGGNVNVTGTLSKGAGTFKIDHPLDPANKYLYHSFVESPDMMNIYNGNVVLDSRGEATIQLPNYFDALNKEFRYQLTCIGGYAPVYVAQEISGNTFRIAGGTANLKVSWQVTGVRKDAFANAHRIQVEVDKPASERGKYVHPVENGVPESMGTEYEQTQVQFNKK